MDATARTVTERESEGPRLTVHIGAKEHCAFLVAIGGIRGRAVFFELSAWQEIPRHERPEGFLSEDGRAVMTFTPQNAVS